PPTPGVPASAETAATTTTRPQWRTWRRLRLTPAVTAIEPSQHPYPPDESTHHRQERHRQEGIGLGSVPVVHPPADEGPGGDSARELERDRAVPAIADDGVRRWEGQKVELQH